MADVVMKTSQQWYDLVQARWPSFQVMDADGWNRANFDESWGEQISEDMFWNRTASSTCSLPFEMLECIVDPTFSILTE